MHGLLPWLRDCELAKLVCAIPVYGTDGGNYTELWFEDGRRVVVNNRLRTVIGWMARFFGVDVDQEDAVWHREAKKSHSNYSHRNRPLALIPSIILVPVAVRKPQYRDHGGVGYVVRQKILGWEKYEGGEYRSRLFLAGGQILFCLHNDRTLTYRITLADRIGRRYQEIVTAL
ncbi:hypothetical protein MGLY_21290 [Neomoorella glycerini]|uniref:Uncharacterized protein n=1 Tax=Neomoorella glycerini TaxID=55779 RepID=A0A6I5ZSN7_9FIRM|nr:hypothetical protein [Moorella glycerini]QGP92739.1 hypothetical protein MGLY_21290 [Moorella glycerini]